MKMTVDRSTFMNEFKAYNRLDNFSGWALNQLFDYFEQYEADCGQEIELDVIAICCDYSEMSFEDAKSNYEQDDLSNDEFLEYLEENTQIIAYDDENVIYAAF